MRNCYQTLLSISTCAATHWFPGHHARSVGAVLGRGWAVQVDPIKPTLKAPGTNRLKLNCDELLPTFAFKFNLRRYTAVPLALLAVSFACFGYVAGAVTRPLLSST